MTGTPKVSYFITSQISEMIILIAYTETAVTQRTFTQMITINISVGKTQTRIQRTESYQYQLVPIIVVTLVEVTPVYYHTNNNYTTELK
jgi:hypothetical protein